MAVTLAHEPVTVAVEAHLDSTLAACINEAATDLPLNDAYADWIQAVRESSPRNFRLDVLTAARGGARLAVGIAFHAAVDLDAYTTHRIGGALRALRRLGLGSFPMVDWISLGPVLHRARNPVPRQRQRRGQ